MFKLIGRTYSKAFEIVGDNVFMIASIVVFTFSCVLLLFGGLTEVIYWLLLHDAMNYALMVLLGLFALSGAAIMGRAATQAVRDNTNAE